MQLECLHWVCQHNVRLKTNLVGEVLLLLSRFSRVQLCATPNTSAHQAPPSLGFSRQEHWSGLLFPSPMHESENWKWSRSVTSDSSRPLGLQPTGLLHPWDFPRKSTGVGCHCLLHLFGGAALITDHVYLQKCLYPSHFCSLLWTVIYGKTKWER